MWTDTHDPCKESIGARKGKFKIRTDPQRERLGRTRSAQRVHQRDNCAQNHSASDATRTIPAEGSSAMLKNTRDPCKAFIGSVENCTALQR